MTALRSPKGPLRQNAARKLYSTPQDALIAQVFGKSVQHATDRATPPPPSNAPQPSVTSDSLPTPPSIPVAPSRARPGPTVTIYDPFSGAKLSERTPISPPSATPGESSASPPVPTVDDRKLWSSLERILELQAEIAAMHADMEGVGGKGPGNNTQSGGTANVGAGEGSNAGPRKRSRRGQTLPIGDEEPEEHGPEGGATGGAVSEISTDHSDGEDEDDDEDDMHGNGKRRRDEEFARLAEQFVQRKATIGGIMNKLDALSTALKTFHTLPPPLFDLAMSPSRTDTMSPAPSNASATSFPPRSMCIPDAHRLRSRPSLHLTLGISSPLQRQPLSPPVPPISTLAPRPVSSGDPRPAPGLAHVVAPVLPPTAMPTIIPGSPHVESPVDMAPPQSIFQEVP
ncbi:hypothetical protein HD554DRAFT_397127 [Boletus coccyginus]|nr:hypothetical protein HD554DRAFT_397127 [Boletus coccyginus]